MCVAGSTAIKQSTSLASSPAAKHETVELYVASRLAGGGGGGGGEG